jgi:hypothetical protein
MVANDRFQSVFGHQIDFAPQEGHKLALNSVQAQKGRPCSWPEADQKINITIGTVVLVEHRPEERQLAHLVATAEGCEFVKGQVRWPCVIDWLMCLSHQLPAPECNMGGRVPSEGCAVKGAWRRREGGWRCRRVEDADDGRPRCTVEGPRGSRRRAGSASPAKGKPDDAAMTDIVATECAGVSRAGNACRQASRTRPVAIDARPWRALPAGRQALGRAATTSIQRW